MNKHIPAWAMRRARPEDHALVRASHRQGTLQITWPDLKLLRGWAKQHDWPTPWVGFEAAFITTMLNSEATYLLAITESGVDLRIPKQDHTLSPHKLRDLDALYEERSPDGRPTGWGSLVEELREIRRAVEAGVVVRVGETQTLGSWQEFYEWAHGRYHMLEDGSDHWIGDDIS